MKLSEIIKNVKFFELNNLKKNEVLKILNIRNEKNIRKNMISKNYISENEHNLWVDKINTSKESFFFAIKYKSSLIGGLAVNLSINSDKVADWAFYISSYNKFVGIGLCLELKSLDFIFNEFEINELQCLVLLENKQVFNLHKRFGFKEIPYNKMHRNFFFKKQIEDIACLNIKKNEWNRERINIIQKYFK